MKYKKGNKVTIGNINHSCHEFTPGEEVTIIECYPKGSSPHYRAKRDSGVGHSTFIQNKDIKD